MIKKLILLLTACALTVSAEAQKKPAHPAQTTQATTPSDTMTAGPVALKGGKLLTITHGVIENGVVVMEGGKITAVGGPSTAIPHNARVIDVTGMTVYPGLIDSNTQLGLTEISADRMTNDESESSDNIMPHMHVADAFHAESSLIPVTRINGITNAIVAPGDRDSLPGQDAFIQLAGRNASDMLMVRDIAMPMNFTGDQRRNESFQNSRYPSTRMGVATQLRQTFIDAQEYAQKLDDYKNKGASKSDKDKGPGAPPKRDLKLEAVLPYLRGEKPVVVSAEEGYDAETALALAREFKLKVILSGLVHAQNVLDDIAAAKVPVVVGSIYTLPRPDERYDAVYSLPAELAKRGVKIALATYDAHNVRNLPYEAGYAVAYGLPYDEALKSITLNPAEIWGLADKLGSLDVGKLGNVVVSNGDPLDVKTDVKHVFINGAEIPLTSRQTELRDEYMKH